MSQEEEKHFGGKRSAAAAGFDLTEEKESKKPRVAGDAIDVSLEPFEEEILNGDREASKALKAAAQKKTEQAAAWKKLFDEAQADANRLKDLWAAAEVKAYRLVSALLPNQCYLIDVIYSLSSNRCSRCCVLQH